MIRKSRGNIDRGSKGRGRIVHISDSIVNMGVRIQRNLEELTREVFVSEPVMNRIKPRSSEEIKSALVVGLGDKA